MPRDESSYPFTKAEDLSPPYYPHSVQQTTFLNYKVLMKRGSCDRKAAFLELSEVTKTKLRHSLPD